MSKILFTTALVASAVGVAQAGTSPAACADVDVSEWPEEAGPLVDAGGCTAIAAFLGMGLSCNTDLSTNVMVQQMAGGVTGSICDFCCGSCTGLGETCEDHGEDHGTVDCDMSCTASCEQPTTCESASQMLGDQGCASTCDKCVHDIMSDMLGCDFADVDDEDEPKDKDDEEHALPEGCSQTLMDMGCGGAATCYDEAECNGSSEGACSACLQAYGMCDVCFPKDHGDTDKPTEAPNSTTDTGTEAPNSTTDTGTEAPNSPTDTGTEAPNSAATTTTPTDTVVPVVSAATTVSAMVASVAAAVSVCLF